MEEKQELFRRIAELEAENSALRDKLDLIYSIVAPGDEVDDAFASEDAGEAEAGDTLIQIRKVN